MVSLSLKEAAEQTGKTKPAIFKAIQKGRISATKNENGEWIIEPSELFRVYPPANQKPQTTATEFTIGNSKLAPDNSGLLAENEKLAALLAITQERVEELKQDRDEWRTQAQRLAITHQKPLEAKRRWFGLLGRKG